MLDANTWKKAWALLDRRERRNAWFVLATVAVAALSSAVMIGSIMPFLSVLARTERIHQVPALAWAYRVGGFTSDYGFLIGLGLASLGVIVVSNLLQVLRAWAVTRYTSKRIHTLSHRLLATYLRQPYEFFLDHHSGAMSTRILSEAQLAVLQFFVPAADVIASFMTVIVIVSLLLWINPLVALACFITLGGIYGGTFLLIRRMISHAGRIRTETNAERYRIANEALGGIKDIKLLGRESAYINRYRSPSQRMAEAQFVSELSSQLPQYVMQIIAFGGMIVLCLVLVDPSGLASGNGLGTILPLLGVFAFAGQRLMPELQRLYGGVTRLQYGRAGVEAVHEDLVLQKLTESFRPASTDPLSFKSELRLDRVSYCYPKADKPGLYDVSLAVRAGEKIGIVGSSGAGKTTLADVVLGLLRPTGGTLCVDGTVLTDNNIRAWQQRVGYVPQDIFLTDSSVAENIALGIPAEAIDLDKVKRAAQVAQLDHFIRDELPSGYETTVGERGVRLSGGQRQRIGIARAMYHDADLIVFDEATSALDQLTERDVMAALDMLPGDKTALIIAHRLSTVRRCDRILLLERGRVSGFDTWERLIASNEGFRKIAEAA
jgi:ABC-type multidrug transport system fused ATPase/permease subunit